MFDTWTVTVYTVVGLSIIFVVLYLLPFLKSVKDKTFDNTEAIQASATFGVLGTFIGISIGLFNFDANNIEDSIPFLLDGMRTAFVTSILGMVVSVILRYYLLGELQKAGKSEENTEANINDLIRFLKDENLKEAKNKQALILSVQEINKSIVGDGDSTLLTQIQKMRYANHDDLESLKLELVNEFRGFAQQMAENNSKAFIKALEETIRDFNNKLQEQFGENFKQLNMAVEKLVIWQEEYKNVVIEVTENQKIIFNGIEQANISLNSMAKHSDSIQNSAANLRDIIVTAKFFETQLKNILESLGKIGQDAQIMVPAISELNSVVMENIKSSNAEFNKSIQDVSNNVLAEIEKNADGITALSNAVIENMDDTVRDLTMKLNSLSENIIELLEHQGDKLDSAFNKSIESVQIVSDRLERSAIEVTQRVSNDLVAMNEENNKVLRNNQENLSKNMGNVINKSLADFSRELVQISTKFAEDYTPLANNLREIVRLSEHITKSNRR